MRSVAEVARPAVAADALRAAESELHRAGIEAPRREAELLLTTAWSTDCAGLRLRDREPVPAAVAHAFHTMLQRRLGREPIQYILGTWEFWSVEIAVCADVLVPRPETELLVERTLEIVARMESLPATDTGAEPRRRLADVGTGSGCIAIALAKELPGAEVWATDISPAALAVAAANAARNGVADRVHFVATDLCTGLPEAGFDVVVSNPPYIPTAELAALAPEIAWEPRGALDGGGDGLATIRRLLPAAAIVLRPGGWLLLEMAIDQGDAILARLGDAEWRDAAVHPDLSGRPRIVVARRAGDGA